MSRLINNNRSRISITISNEKEEKMEEASGQDSSTGMYNNTTTVHQRDDTQDDTFEVKNHVPRNLMS